MSPLAVFEATQLDRLVGSHSCLLSLEQMCDDNLKLLLHVVFVLFTFYLLTMSALLATSC